MYPDITSKGVVRRRPSLVPSNTCRLCPLSIILTFTQATNHGGSYHQPEYVHHPNGLLVHQPRSYDHACQTSQRLPLKAMGHEHARSDRKQFHILHAGLRHLLVLSIVNSLFLLLRMAEHLLLACRMPTIMAPVSRAAIRTYTFSNR